jgi:hypothetical protein
VCGLAGFGKPVGDDAHLRVLTVGRILTFTRPEWDAFVRGVKAGEFDPA